MKRGALDGLDKERTYLTNRARPYRSNQISHLIILLALSINLFMMEILSILVIPFLILSQI